MASVEQGLKAGKRDAFGCQVSNLVDDRTIATRSLTFHRKLGAKPPGQVLAPAMGNGYLIGLSVAGGHRRKIFHEHHATVHDFQENALYLRRSSEDYKADLDGSFNFLLMEISNSDLVEIAEQADARGVSELSEVMAEPDPVLGGMMQALFAAHMANTNLRHLFLDQMASAIGAHLVHRYGNGRKVEATTSDALSHSALIRVTDLMRSRLKDGVTLDELAAVCAMSRARFMRAFQLSTGKTPDAWMAGVRLEEACAYLRRSDMSFTDIATFCGFRDLSHFRGAFIRSKGVSPEAWRTNGD